MLWKKNFFGLLQNSNPTQTFLKKRTIFRATFRTVRPYLRIVQNQLKSFWKKRTIFRTTSRTVRPYLRMVQNMTQKVVKTTTFFLLLVKIKHNPKCFETAFRLVQKTTKIPCMEDTFFGSLKNGPNTTQSFVKNIGLFCSTSDCSIPTQTRMLWKYNFFRPLST